MLPLGFAAALAASASSFFLASLTLRLCAQVVCPQPLGRGSFQLQALFSVDRRSHGQGLEGLVEFLRELSREVAWPWCIYRVQNSAKFL